MKPFPDRLAATQFCASNSDKVDRLKQHVKDKAVKINNGVDLGYCKVLGDGAGGISLVGASGLTAFSGRNVTRAQVDAAIIQTYW